MVLPQQPSCQGSRDELGRERWDAESIKGPAEADGDKHAPLRVLSGEEMTGHEHSDKKKIVIRDSLSEVT